MILNSWQSATLADILTNLVAMPSGPLILFLSKDLIILLISLAVGFGRSNLLSVLKTLYFLNASMVTIYWYQLINQSINQSINVFQGKIQTVQFRNIYKHILFLRDIHMKLVIMLMKTN